MSNCSVREPLRKVHEAISRLLASITIADISSGDISPDSAKGSRASGQLIGIDELVRS